MKEIQKNKHISKPYDRINAPGNKMLNGSGQPSSTKETGFKATSPRVSKDEFSMANSREKRLKTTMEPSTTRKNSIPLPTSIHGKNILKAEDFQSFRKTENEVNLPVVLIIGAQNGSRKTSIVGVDFLRGLPKDRDDLFANIDEKSAIAFLLPEGKQFEVPIQQIRAVDSSGYILHNLLHLNTRAMSRNDAAEGRVLFSACLAIGVFGEENKVFAKEMLFGLDQSDTFLGTQAVFHASREIRSHDLLNEVISRGANVNDEYEAMSPIEHANRLGDSKMIEILQNAGAVNDLEAL